MSGIILASESSRYNNYSLQRSLYFEDFVFGDANDPNSTPAMDPADEDTYKFALRMPSIGFLHHVKVMFESQDSGLDTGTIDFRLWRVPFDEDSRDVKYDLVYEMRGIMLGQIREHKMTDRPLIFANRIGYSSLDPDGQAVTYPRNFLWAEVRPNDSTAVAPIVRVGLAFEV